MSDPFKKKNTTTTATDAPPADPPTIPPYRTWVVKCEGITTIYEAHQIEVGERGIVVFAVYFWNPVAQQIMSVPRYFLGPLQAGDTIEEKNAMFAEPLKS